MAESFLDHPGMHPLQEHHRRAGVSEVVQANPGNADGAQQWQEGAAPQIDIEVQGTGAARASLRQSLRSGG